MSQGTIYGSPSIRVALLKGLVKHYKLDISIEGKDALNKDVFPLGKVPAFVGPKGFKLTEVIAIVLYVISLGDENSLLLGKTKEDYAQIIKWLSLANSELLPQLANAFGPLIGRSPYNKKQVTDGQLASDKVAAVLESRLNDYTYLVGERLTLADLFVATLATRGFDHLWGKEWRSAHPNIVRWFKTVTAHPIIADQYTSYKFRDAPVEFTPPKKEKKEQAPKPKAAAAPKAKKEEEDAPPAEAPKPKHPLLALGKPTKLDLDEWKRIYSNEETREVALPWLWEHYDSSEWSLWRVDYKYNDELTLTFMSNNLLGGFFNRLSASTKYLFGSGVVYGENNNNGIVAVFLVRGDKHEPAFDVAPDWESYQFQKLDPSKPEDKEFVEDIFAWDKPVIINGESREVADGKNFK